MAATILTASDLALELGTDPRTARKFLRSITPRDAQPGKGSRWGIEKKSIRSMRPKFTKFVADEEARREAREAAKVATAEVIADEAIDEALEADEEPTDEALTEIDDED